MKNVNTKTENKFIVFSMGIATILLVMSLFSILVMPVFSAANDSFQLNVTVNNVAPSVSNINVNDSNGGTIQLLVSNLTGILCNATITDPNGFADISSANATLYFNGNHSNDTDDINYHYTNSTCTLSVGSGTTRDANCTFNISFAATNGTWWCNVTAKDTSAAVNSSTGSNIVDQLIAMSAWNASINFSAMNNGENTTAAGARAVNISNEGNVAIDLAVKAQSADMSCATSGTGCSGAIGVGNLSFNTTQDTYDNLHALGFNLTTTNQTMTAWDLDPKGIDTADTVNSSKNMWWGIQIPQGVKGEFNVNITITSLVG